MSSNTANKSSVLSEEIKYQAKYFRIKSKTIERNGKTFIKDFIDRNPAVLILPINDKNEIYLELQYRDAFEKTLLEVVAGNIEHNSDPLESAKRELLEETGLIAENWKKIANLELSVNMNSPLHIFLATGLTENKAQLNDDEVIEMVKMPFEEAVKKALSGEIVSAGHVAAILLYDALKKEGKL